MSNELSVYIVDLDLASCLQVLQNHKYLDPVS